MFYLSKILINGTPVIAIQKVYRYGRLDNLVLELEITDSKDGVSELLNFSDIYDKLGNLSIIGLSLEVDIFNDLTVQCCVYKKYHRMLMGHFWFLEESDVSDLLLSNYSRIIAKDKVSLNITSFINLTRAHWSKFTSDNTDSKGVKDLLFIEANGDYEKSGVGSPTCEVLIKKDINFDNDSMTFILGDDKVSYRYKYDNEFVKILLKVKMLCQKDM